MMARTINKYQKECGELRTEVALLKKKVLAQASKMLHYEAKTWWLAAVVLETAPRSHVHMKLDGKTRMLDTCENILKAADQALERPHETND